ncbi:MAG: cytochrome c oxidase subunit II [Geminicoccaceae bacterium]|nr:MAG: cytochrome c oxidase subunit II [Geminicoccaceae bacterium]
MWGKAGLATAAGLVATLGAGIAAAGEPVPWQLGMQAAAAPIKEQVISLHDLILVIITAICLFVLALLLYVAWRFRAAANPTPTRVTHNTALEVAWTAVPVLILVIIAVPSFRLLYFEDRIPEADITIKAIGKQWYWTYEYPDHGNFTFDAFMLSREEAEAAGVPALLATDEDVVVPAGATVRVLITATDVLHSWAIPAFGVKRDAIPGRLNETWFRAETPGMYYGQCSELCGVGHGFMPIAVRVVPEAEFAAWIEEAQTRFARVDRDFDVAGR